MTQPSPWHLARRTAQMNPSVIREILKITEQPGILSLAGGLPSPETFPIEAMREACARVLRDTPREALPYAAWELFNSVISSANGSAVGVASSAVRPPASSSQSL